MTRIKGQLTTADYLPIGEFNRLVESLHNDRLFLWELFCRLSFCMALRASDIRSLKWKDFLNKEKLVRTEIKTGKTREIVFHPSVKKSLSELYGLLGSPDENGYAILNPRTGKAYSLEYINRKLKTFRVTYRLPIEAFSTHTFRKTFGRYIYEESGKSAESLILLSSIFKHSSIEITKIYIGIRQSEINRVFDTIRF
jgi:integrase